MFPLGRQGAACRDSQLVRDSRNLSQLALRAAGEKRDPAKELGFRVFPEKHPGIVVARASLVQLRVVVVTQW